MPSYDSAVTVFSPDGHLFQVEYAQEAVKMGSPAVGICGKNVIVLVVEAKATEKLQQTKTMRKIYSIDHHIIAAFAGLTADARVVMEIARIHCQSYSLTYDDQIHIESLTRYIADLKQEYTQSNGRRPFGMSMLIAGFNIDKTPHLYQTDPSGSYLEWKANAIGKHSKLLMEYLEKHYKEEDMENEEQVINLALKTMLQHSTGTSLEVAILRADQPMQNMPSDVLEEHVKRIQAEIEEADLAKRRRAAISVI